MKKFCSIIILAFLLNLSTEYIEREEIPKDLGLNVLEIYNYREKILIFFDGYHQSGVIYLGDYKDIQQIYDFSDFDFILVKDNTSDVKNLNFHYIGEITNIELQDEDNNLVIIDENTIYFELKRFKFIISNDLGPLEHLYKYDPQFFILNQMSDISKVLESFSIEHIYLVTEEYPSEDFPLVSVIPKGYYVQFICNDSSYKHQFKIY
ncbi:hypothetical protein SAMN02745227_01062 [Anaerobranca californiensis DSM 14826]|jgi:hypothetical protein|uniref:Uncharacterized protein n=1 Tax=Anaerobranca californiensis DSM 14826 TaxID=1120989 RepID=A0A1M6N8G7_9FIRM|nr:hypothetical protein [Anaerobranca californiensis]SHJ92009.1 hypothetical protein SAMN02745227_01062 [Anaerobranca californiensis DSM 14826]